MIEPLRVEVVLDCSVEHAFTTWTERFSSWWPRGHSVSGDPAAVTLEPHVGGRIYERTQDGEEIDWGEITTWDPPRRLGYRWHIRRPPTEAHADWMELGSADEGKQAKDGTLEAWARAADNPVGGWYGLRKGYRGRFAMYIPPLLEHLGLVELEHNPRNNHIRAS